MKVKFETCHSTHNIQETVYYVVSVIAIQTHRLTNDFISDTIHRVRAISRCCKTPNVLRSQPAARSHEPCCM